MIKNIFQNFRYNFLLTLELYSTYSISRKKKRFKTVNQFPSNASFSIRIFQLLIVSFCQLKNGRQPFRLDWTRVEYVENWIDEVAKRQTMTFLPISTSLRSGKDELAFKCGSTFIVVQTNSCIPC